MFVLQADARLTGQKIIVDRYGGWGDHGGGASSGKDLSRVKCSAAYAARWIAKSLVKAGFCRRVLTQVKAIVKVIYQILKHKFCLRVHTTITASLQFQKIFSHSRMELKEFFSGPVRETKDTG